MKILIYFILLLLITTSCTLNKVVKKHGVRNLEKKQNELSINQSNTLTKPKCILDTQKVFNVKIYF